MTVEEVVRAWKDPQYRASIPHADTLHLPVHPSGELIGLQQVLSAELSSIADMPCPITWSEDPAETSCGDSTFSEVCSS